MTSIYDAILFDFDGVLADSEPIHWSCWSDLLKPLSIDLTWEIYAKNLVGVQDQDMLPFLATLAKQSVTAEILAPLFPRKKELFRTRVAENNPIQPETIELIRSLDDFKLGLVTSSGLAEVKPVVEQAGIGEKFSAMVFGEDVEHHKPAPDPYLLAAARLGAKRPLVVEDSNAGVASARAAGFDVIQTPSSAAVPGLVRSQLRKNS